MVMNEAASAPVVSTSVKRLCGWLYDSVQYISTCVNFGLWSVPGVTYVCVQVSDLYR